MNHQSTARLGRITLAARLTPFHRDDTRRAAVLFFGALLAIVGMGVFLMVANGKPLAEQSDLIWGVGGLLLLGLGLPWLLWLKQQHVHLILDANGLHYRNRFPFFSRLSPDWDLPWGAITRVEYRGRFHHGDKPDRLRHIILHGQTGKPRKLDPGQWIDIDPQAEDFAPAYKGVFFAMSRHAIEAAKQKAAVNSPLVQALVDNGWPLRPPGEELTPTAGTNNKEKADKGFNLMSHPGLAVMTVLMLGLLLYFLVDTFVLSPWRYASPAPTAAFALVGLLVAATAYGLGRGAPRRERLGVAVMLGLAVAAAQWPAALHLNAATTDAMPQAVEYRQIEAGVYEAVEGEHPNLRFHGFEDYWTHHMQPERRRFHLLQGPLGFWQVDFEPIRQDIHIFYKTMPDEEGDH